MNKSDVNELTNETAMKESSTSVPIVINDSAVAELVYQRTELNKFIKACLVESVDFGIIPGSKNPSLYKPGAEKLAKLFKLGSKIADCSKEIDIPNGWAMFSYTIEIFHIPTGTSIAQCEGSANNKEKKYISRNVTDMLNTLQKMAQKRAYVGAIIIATGASDFFTQDIEDMDLHGDTPPPKKEYPKKDLLPQDQCEHRWLQSKFKPNEEWCPNCKGKRIKENYE